jgi:tetratricopeptide (TPR) repeat protein/tRNA A-37 threonylcarbamoyl transferase component Bud32
MTPCPNRDQLELLLAKRLDHTIRDHVELHVESCEACQQMLEVLTGSTDWEASEAEDVDMTRTAQDGAGDAGYAVGTLTSRGDRFRILRSHARGGLGAVFVALDTELNREVALKQIIEAHADDAMSRQRFLLEAEITGGLEHPGIVPVYGLGADTAGRPYYAMRLIRGESLKEAILHFQSDPTVRSDPGRRSLALRKLLRSFIDVCNAIDYAHSRGVLHRDLKPSNVIVGTHGETLVVDWGLGKPVGRIERGDDSGERALLPSSASGSAETLPGSALGTPSYMSPEQARGELDRLSPRSDVYSLGATLYCLLTGRPPVDGEDVGEVLRRAQQGEFPKPKEVDPSLDPALEAVCLRAMAKESLDRYSSCRALADEIERWMADEPVDAYPEPLPRRARRWAKRNRTPAAAALVALVAGTIGLGAVATVQAQANTRLRHAHAATKAALLQSEESRQQAEAVSAFLVDAFRRPDPAQDGREVKVADVLDRAAGKLEAPFAGSPVTKGALLDAIGRTFHGLGLYERAATVHGQALAVREAALGRVHLDTLRSRSNLGVALGSAGRPQEAIALGEPTVELLAAKLGPDHPDTLTSRNGLAIAYWAAGRTRDAVAHHEATLKLREARLGPDHAETLTSRNNLAIAYWDASRLPEAISLFEATAKARRATLGPDHVDTLTSLSNLASAYRRIGKFREAIALTESTLKLRETKLGADHPATLLSRNNLAATYAEAGDLAKAIPLFEETHRLRAATLHSDHPDTLGSASDLAEAYRMAGLLPEAIALHEATLTVLEAKLGLGHPATLLSRKNLAAAYAQSSRVSEAIELFKATLALREAKLGPEHHDVLTSRNDLAEVYLIAGRIALATELLEANLASSEKVLGPDHPDTLRSRSTLADAYAAAGSLAEADQVLQELVARRRQIVGPASPLLANDLAQLGRNLLDQGRPSEAEPLFRECLAIVEKATPDVWFRYDALALLGWSILDQDRYADAEPALVDGYEGLLARQARIPLPQRSHLREAAEHLVRLYEVWNKPSEAAEWKAKVGMRDLPDDLFAAP